mmetsp:Transcript_30599/g.71496  ORF Transcript_30599/g.71496 Transcript_30599/m.71496 type:complete len:200 (+) Transcript_30599:1371-1970(+)
MLKPFSDSNYVGTIQHHEYLQLVAELLLMGWVTAVPMPDRHPLDMLHCHFLPPCGVPQADLLGLPLLDGTKVTFSEELTLLVEVCDRPTVPPELKLPQHLIHPSRVCGSKESPRLHLAVHALCHVLVDDGVIPWGRQTRVHALPELEALPTTGQAASHVRTSHHVLHTSNHGFVPFNRLLRFAAPLGHCNSWLRGRKTS